MVVELLVLMVLNLYLSSEFIPYGFQTRFYAVSGEGNVGGTVPNIGWNLYHQTN